MNVEYKFEISAKDYLELRKAVGWTIIDIEDAQNGIDNSFVNVSAIYDGQTIGAARLLWDHGYFAFLADVMVKPEYQGKGVGKAMVKMAIDKLEESIKEGHKVKIELVPACGKTSFYENFGFKTKAKETHDRAMAKTISK